MSLEQPHLSTENQETLHVTSLEEYFELVKDSDSLQSSLVIKNAEERMQEVEQWSENKKKADAAFLNEKNEEMLHKLVENEMVDDLGIISDDDKAGGTQVYVSNIENGFRVQSFPVYEDSTDVVSGHHYYRDRNNLSEENNALKASIESSYSHLYVDSWMDREQKKDELLQQEVQRGEMVYLGEMSFDNYIEMLKKGLNGDNVEEVVVFDADKKALSDRTKVYARI